MKSPSNALLVLAAVACAAALAGSGVIFTRLASPEPALIRVAEGMYPDCGGAGWELLAGRDRDRNGVLADQEAEVSAVACHIEGRVEVPYEPEPLRSAFETESGARPGERVLLDFWGPPAGAGCGEARLGLSAGVDADRDNVLAEAEITDKRLVCGPPMTARYARAH
jgi:hypothetical protein